VEPLGIDKAMRREGRTYTPRAISGSEPGWTLARSARMPTAYLSGLHYQLGNRTDHAR